MTKWYYSFPIFEMSDRFTFFNDLIEPNNYNSPIIKTIKEGLWHKAVDKINTAKEFLSENLQSTELISALQFLEQAAISERQKEVALLKAYKEKLRSELPINKDIDQILDDLDNADLDDIGQLDNFYKELTNCLNTLRKTAQGYKNRLDQFKKHNQGTYQDLFKDDMRFRGEGDVRSLINNLTGMATRGQENKINGFANILRTKTFELLNKYGVIDKVQSGEDFVAIAAALMFDIENEFQEELLKSERTDFLELDEEIDKIIENYETHSFEQQTRVQRALTGNYNDLKTIISSAKNTLGISSIEADTFDGFKRSYTATQRSKRLKKENSMYRQFKDLLPSKIFKELPLVTISGRTKQSHGNLFEFISTLFGNGFKVAGNPATDLMSLEFSFEDNPELENAIRDYVKMISQKYTEFTKEERLDRQNSTTEAFNQMNKNVAEITHDLDNYLKQLDTPIKDIFIYHESLKLYGTVESGTIREFDGRELVILSYIDEMYSLGGLSGLQLPDQDALIFIAANLAKSAVGASARGPLEKYFSIFAGLLMFDDVKNIALEAANTLQYENVTNIHLYNLNGIYVPASLLLTYTHKAILDSTNELLAGRAANAHISTSGAEKVIDDWLQANSPYKGTNFKGEWGPVADKVLSGTKVRITFFASFINFINNLML